MVRNLAILVCVLGLVGLVQVWWFLSTARAVGGYDSYYILLPTFTPSLILMLDFNAGLPRVDKPAAGVAITIPGWIAGVLLAGYPVWTLFAKPVRNHLRHRRGLCVQCGYNLAGNTIGVCPECGTPKARD